MKRLEGGEVGGLVRGGLTGAPAADPPPPPPRVCDAPPEGLAKHDCVLFTLTSSTVGCQLSL